MFITALFTIAKTWKQPKCPLTDEGIKKLWYVGGFFLNLLAACQTIGRREYWAVQKRERQDGKEEKEGGKRNGRNDFLKCKGWRVAPVQLKMEISETEASEENEK